MREITAQRENGVTENDHTVDIREAHFSIALITELETVFFLVGVPAVHLEAKLAKALSSIEAFEGGNTVLFEHLPKLTCE